MYPATYGIVTEHTQFFPTHMAIYCISVEYAATFLPRLFVHNANRLRSGLVTFMLQELIGFFPSPFSEEKNVTVQPLEQIKGMLKSA
jgi:hypothetical protein